MFIYINYDHMHTETCTLVRMGIFGLYLYLLGESYQDGYLSTPYQDTARFICSRDFDSNIFVDTRDARLQVTSMLLNGVYRLYSNCMTEIVARLDLVTHRPTRCLLCSYYWFFILMDLFALP